MIIPTAAERAASKPDQRTNTHRYIANLVSGDIDYTRPCRRSDGSATDFVNYFFHLIWSCVEVAFSGSACCSAPSGRRPFTGSTVTENRVPQSQGTTTSIAIC